VYENRVPQKIFGPTKDEGYNRLARTGGDKECIQTFGRLMQKKSKNYSGIWTHSSFWNFLLLWAQTNDPLYVY
jgi:hypothetical protein